MNAVRITVNIMTLENPCLRRTKKHAFTSLVAERNLESIEARTEGAEQEESIPGLRFDEVSGYR
jgi:hypothetical protein